MANKNKLVVGISLALFAGSAMAANQPAADEQSLVVMFKPSVSKVERETVVRSVGGILRETDAEGRDLRMRYVADGRINKITVANAAQRDRVIKQLTRHPLVEVAEPNYIWTTQASEIRAVDAPNDQFFDVMWNLHNTGQEGGTPGADISALEAWAISKGDANIVIGVIDTGIDYSHPDLVGNMWHNPGEICDNGIDDTGNGVIDDCHGFNAITGTGNPMDVDGHGTHVAGTIGASSNNGIGVAGVNWDVQLAACKFLGPTGGTTLDGIACIDYFTDLKVNHGVNVVATNNSWGGGPYSEALRAAIQTHTEAGIMFVTASGNDARNVDTVPDYPGTYDLPGIVNVANTTRTDALAVLSNFGAVTVDLGAPGSNIPSTYLNNGYAYASGTSMASPHVAGVASLVWSIAPHLSIAEVKDILMSSGDPTSALAGATVSGNRLNAHQALLDADPEPGFRLNLDPRNLQITAGENVRFVIDIGAVAGWSGEVEVAVDIDPALDHELSSNVANAGESITLTVYTDSDTDWGTYAIQVSGLDTETGELTGAAAGTLTVIPADLLDFPYENNTSMAIPDNNPAGITSVISVPEQGVIFDTEVSVNITHTWRGDLIVRVISPAGTERTLHNRDGGSASDLIQTWSLDTFNGESMNGDWTLFVSDNAGLDTGTLNGWSMVLTAASDSEPTPGEPVAGFDYSVDGMTVSFTNTSSADYDIVSYAWDFGDGASSTEANPVHTYAAEGSYSVSLTVVDAEGQQNTTSQMVTISLTDIDVEVLSASKLRSGSATVQLLVSGADGEVDVYRDGNLVGTFGNRVRDRFTTTADSVEYEVCPAGSYGAGCSVLTVTF